MNKPIIAVLLFVSLINALERISEITSEIKAFAKHPHFSNYK